MVQAPVTSSPTLAFLQPLPEKVLTALDNHEEKGEKNQNFIHDGSQSNTEDVKYIMSSSVISTKVSHTFLLLKNRDA